MLRLLLATDGSECSEQAREFLTLLPLPAGSSIEVVSVIDQVVGATAPALEDGTLVWRTGAEIREAERKRAWEWVRQAEAALVRDEVTTNGGIVNPGNTQETAQFIMAVSTVFDWTGDLAFLREMYPGMKQGLRWLLTDSPTPGTADVSGNICVAGTLAGDTPGTSRATSRKLRPFRGRLPSSCSGIVPAIWLRAASRTVVSAVTTTPASTPASSSEIGSSKAAPAESVNAWVTSRKPGWRTVTV